MQEASLKIEILQNSKRSINQKVITILNLYTLNNIALKYIKQMLEKKQTKRQIYTTAEILIHIS